VSARPKPQQIIRINARGRQFDTSRQTLSRTDSPVLQDVIARATVQRPVDLNVDPHVFGHVLNFLRDGAGFMLPNDSYELLALLELAGNLSMPEQPPRIGPCAQARQANALLDKSVCIAVIAL